MEHNAHEIRHELMWLHEGSVEIGLLAQVGLSIDETMQMIEAEPEVLRQRVQRVKMLAASMLEQVARLEALCGKSEVV